MTTDSTDDMLSPILPDLKEISKFDIAVDKTGKVYLFYTDELSAVPEYAEYDSEMNSLSFMDDQGRVQNSGLTIKDAAKPHLQRADSIILVKVNDDFSINKARNIQMIGR